MALSRVQATAIGMCAPVCWATSVGLMRRLTELGGPCAGMALMATFAAAILSCVFGLPKAGKFRPKYLVFGVGCAVLCEVCFSLSLAVSDGGRQTIEVGMVNYLWPCLIVLFAVLFNGQRARWWVAPGTLLSFAGICVVLSGDGGFHPAEIAARMAANPWSYLLAFAGAVAWAAYSSISQAISNGQNPVVLIFGASAAILWAAYFAGLSPPIEWSWHFVGYALAMAAVMGGAYACWTVGLVRGGHLTALGIASYFTPVLSCLFGAFWLDATLSAHFWAGVALVVAGSLVCWSATRDLGKP